jgi:two-component system chemotaxis sensor kinase CheA
MEVDAELREVFCEEAGERLEAMQGLLLQGESARDGAELITALFREAHTLKGGAAMVGLSAVARLAHSMEDLLAQVRSGKLDLTPTLVDALLGAVDALGAVLNLVAANEPHEAVVEAAELALRRASSSGGAVAPREGARPPDSELPPPAPDGPPAADGPRAPPSPGAGGQERLPVPVHRLDELVRLIGETVATQLRLGALLKDALGRDPDSVDEFRAFSQVLSEVQEVAMRMRMVPVARILPGLQRAVRDVARISGKRVRFDVSGEDTELDRRILDQLAEALLHIVRNAVDHGMETPDERVRLGKSAEGVVRLEASQQQAQAVVVCSDDGRGIDLSRVREVAGRDGQPAAAIDDAQAMQMIFRSGFSTSEHVSEISGRGVGLDVVRQRLATIQGRMDVSSEPGAGTEFRITVPLTLAVVPSLLATVDGQRFALSMHAITAILPAGIAERWAGGRPVVMVGDRSVRVADLAATLGLPSAGRGSGPAVLLRGHTDEQAFRVDAVLGQRQVVVKALSATLPRLAVIAGASAEPDGSILLVLDPAALIERARLDQPSPATLPDAAAGPAPAACILVVDDAVIVREVERSILEQEGYRVLTAGDGVEALAVLANQACNLVVTDIDMPRMDGLELTARIRALPRLGQLPVVLLTSHADQETHRRGLEAGADGYVVKGAFDRTELLRAVREALAPR